MTPAATEGVSFPYDECEAQIIPKMPFPRMTDPLVSAKTKRDKDYIPYIVIQNVEQMTGRPMRAEDDQCETVIMDGNFGWLRGGYSHFMHRWFTAPIKTIAAREAPPAPPPPLKKRRRDE